MPHKGRAVRITNNPRTRARNMLRLHEATVLPAVPAGVQTPHSHNLFAEAIMAIPYAPKIKRQI